MSLVDNRFKYQLRGPDGNSGRQFGSLSFFVAAGLLVVGLAGAVKSGSQQGAAAPGKARALQLDASVVEAVPTRPELDATLALALESVAQRYRVSPDALQPIFLAAQAAAKDIDPLLVIAVIGIESGFNPFAQSVMGAQGLMQVIPRYHRDKLPAEAGNAGFLDPVSNVRAGTQVLQEAIRRHGGVVEGLQYYVGALDDPDRGYSTRVIAEKQRIEQAIRARKPPAMNGSNSLRQNAAPIKDSTPRAE